MSRAYRDVYAYVCLEDQGRSQGVLRVLGHPLNPCPATPGYIQIQADFKPTNMPLKMGNIVCGGRSIGQITQFRRCLFSKNINISCHLKLEIALAIPASNDEKYNLINSAGQGLISRVVIFHLNIFL